jgi:hypothetical protein
MTSGSVVSVSVVELRNAFDFVSLGAPFEHSAYISLDSGEIYWDSDYAELGGESLPQDLDTSDRYLAVPHKNDLNLGHRLALAFVDQEMANDYATVQGFFRRRGAYGRFKELLQMRGMLQRWYEFEERATEAALRSWCDEHSIQLGDR